jgi:hypothetical protein
LKKEEEEFILLQIGGDESCLLVEHQKEKPLGDSD